MFYLRDLYPGKGMFSTSEKSIPEPVEMSHYLGSPGGRGLIAPTPGLDRLAGVTIPVVVLATIVLAFILGWKG